MGTLAYWLTDPTRVLLIAFSLAAVSIIAFGFLDFWVGTSATAIGKLTGRMLLRLGVFALEALHRALRLFVSVWFLGALADVCGSLVSGGPLIYRFWKYGMDAIKALEAGQMPTLKAIDSGEPIAAVGTAAVLRIAVIALRALAAAATPRNRAH